VDRIEPDNAAPPERPEDDLVLVERVVAGDRRAYETLVRRHERRIFRAALAVVGNVEDAEEAMQDAFVKAFRHIGEFRREARFTTWLTRIAVNEALQKLRARKSLVSLEEIEETAEPIEPHRIGQWHDDPERLYGRAEVREMVEAAIRSLAPIYREAFVLRDLEGLSAEEAAETLGVTVPALKSRLLRARLMMREALAERLEAPQSLKTKIVNKAARMREGVAMRLMRAMSR
jgi:RNA polymerase sigma-70 factor, ECF subfamily